MTDHPRKELAPGLTYRQLDYWTRRGHLKPSNGATPGSGHTREWDPSELAIAQTIGSLRLRGYELAAAARIARAMTREGANQMAVRMWATLPKDHEANGLTNIEKALIADPAETHIVVALLNRKRLKIEDDDNETTPTARIIHIEPLDGDAADQATALLMRALKDRTGAEQLPYDNE